MLSTGNLCNGHVDCLPDSLDENPSLCHTSIKLIHWRKQLLYEIYSQIPDKSDLFTEVHNKSKFTCRSNRTVPAFFVNDLNVDCSSHAEDEHSLVKLLTYRMYSPCQMPNQIACRHGHPKCYNISQICVYHLDFFGHLAPCRNGGHLQECREFACGSKFKCYFSYCIEWIHVCNGRWECPSGNDESYENICNQEINCENMFKCQNTTNHCLPLVNICDSFVQCPFRDDEELCNLKAVKCPEKCKCVHFFIHCENAAMKHFSTQYPFSGIVISNSTMKDIHFVATTFQQSTHVSVLHEMDFNLCQVNLPKTLIYFQLEFAVLGSVSSFCINNLKRLTEIALSNNGIFTIETRSFVNLNSLHLLNLSGNPFSRLPEEFVGNASILKILDLKDTHLLFVHDKAFLNLHLSSLQADSYQVCCFTPASTLCTAQFPWYVSCSNLLPNKFIRWMFGLTFNFVYFSNFFSFILHAFLVTSDQKAYLLIVLLVNFSDSLCSIYLGIIWVADIYYKGTFVSFEVFWRSGLGCCSAYFTLLWFMILTQVALIFLTFSRYNVVAKTMETRFINTTIVLKYTGYIVFTSFSCATTVSILHTQLFNSIPLSICLPNLDPTNSNFITTAVTLLTSLSQILTSVGIVFLNSSTIYFLIGHQRKMKDIKCPKRSYTPLVVQLLLVSLSNVVCWFPTGFLFLSSVFLPSYPIDVVLWSTVCMTPINSVLNPLMFISTSVKTYFHQTK